VIALLTVLGLPTLVNAQQASAELATQLIEKSGLARGICAVIGDAGSLSVEIAKVSELQVHARHPSADVVNRLRSEVDAANLDIHRIIVEQGPIDRLPYADNMIDLLIAPGLTSDSLKRMSLKEIVRVLRPEGKALVGNWSKNASEQLSAQNLEDWNDGSVEMITSAKNGVYAEIIKPRPDGAGDWSHWEHGPDNNPVSEDTIIKAPYMTQFMAKPYYIAMPSITTAAAGRTFLAIGHIAHHRREWDGMNRIIARNGYNGTVLWEKKLPTGYMVHRSAFIATRDTFYMMDGARCLLIDPETGDQTGTVRIPGVLGEWKWMVLRDDVMYVLSGRKDPGAQTTKGDRAFGGWSWGDLSKGYYRKPRVPWGFGNTLTAYDVKKKKLLWKHTEEKAIDSRAMSMGEDQMYYYCPESHLGALKTDDGTVVWKNEDRGTLDLIEEPGKGLTSTPGFRSACLSVATPGAVIIQGQTRMNVVAVSTSQGYKLWSKKKITNNPNAIYVDGRVILGVGPGGSHVELDPITGDVLRDLGFRKTACTRLTASSDSFFVRGEGTLRYDRKSGDVLIDGAQRPACNDGALPANGMLYLGPWQCDCNLSLIGRIAKCSAGDFNFDRTATAKDNLRKMPKSDTVEKFEVSARDWPTFRGDIARSGSTQVEVPLSTRRAWVFTPPIDHTPAAPVSAGGLIFVTGTDGKCRAIDTKGKSRWEFSTAGEIRCSPTVADGRVYLGSGDGSIYTLEAATGRLLWQFRAAPIERLINVYGALSSTWPVNTGVLVHDGIAYCAAGIIDHDGTYVYALDAKTGEIIWQNNSSGHLNKKLRKGVSVQGNLTIRKDQLLMAGGNQVSPAAFDLKTGKSLARPIQQGRPQANNGKFVGVFQDTHAIVGGRILYSSPQNVATKGSFALHGEKGRMTLNWGGIAPAWSDETVVLVNYRNGKLTCCDADKVKQRVAAGYIKRPGNQRRRRANLADSFVADGPRWQTDLGEPNKFETVSLAIAANAAIAVVQQQQKYRAQPQRYVLAFDSKTGRTIWRHELFEEPIPGGLLIDRDGSVVVTTLNGSVVCFSANP
jgi:outer membrane protein assembly factor BamB